MSLADDLAGVRPIQPPANAQRRVHRMEDDPEEDVPNPTRPHIVPFVAGDGKGDLVTAKESLMPRRRKDAGEAPAPTKAKRKYTRRKLPGAAPRKVAGAARFYKNEHGGLEIRDGQQVIQLEPADVKSLVAFLTGKDVRAK